MQPKLELSGDEAVGAPYLKWGMQLHSSGVYGRKALVADGRVVLVLVSESLIRVVVLPGDTGIVCHPRSGLLAGMSYLVHRRDGDLSWVETLSLDGVPGGWQDGKTLLNTRYPFPLVDEDNASFIKTDISRGAFAGDMGMYGNLCWTNGKESFSWRGTPTRHFRLANNINIPGFSTQETATPGTTEATPIFTTFGTKLYQGGTVYAEAPRYSWPYLEGIDRCLILGACQTTAGDVFIVTQSDHYKAPASFAIFSDGSRSLDGSNPNHLEIVFSSSPKSPGVYLTLWKQGGPVDGWSFVSETLYPRNGLPWFADAAGTTFTCPNGDTLTLTGTLALKAATVGRYRESLFNGLFSASISEYRDTVFHEPSGSGTVSITHVAQSSHQSTPIETKTYPGPYKYFRRDRYTYPYVIPTGRGALTAQVGGGIGPYTWTGDGVFSDGRIDPDACGMISVSVTDACGNMASDEIMAPNGYWHTEGYGPWVDPGCPAGFTWAEANGQVLLGSDSAFGCIGEGIPITDITAGAEARGSGSFSVTQHVTQIPDAHLGDCTKYCDSYRTATYTYRCTP